MNIHESMLEEYIAKGYVAVGSQTYAGEQYNEPFTRFDMADPERDCLHPMRTWRVHPIGGVPAVREHHGGCMMPKGHRGRHSTLTYQCDVCGQIRRGTPYRSNDEVSVCGLCVLLNDKRNGARR